MNEPNKGIQTKCASVFVHFNVTPTKNNIQHHLYSTVCFHASFGLNEKFIFFFLALTGFRACVKCHSLQECSRMVDYVICAKLIIGVHSRMFFFFSHSRKNLNTNSRVTFSFSCHQYKGGVEKKGTHTHRW